MRIVLPFFFLFFISTVFCQDLRDRANELGVIGQFGNQFFEGGGGVSFFDFDKDGLEDLTFCTEFNQPLLFFKNTGDSFMPVTFSGIYNYYESKQAVWVDVDNDDDYDLFVTSFGTPDLLYINDGAMNFTNETVLRGLGIYYENSYGVDFSDINNDGWLDIYISNYDDVSTPVSRNYHYLCDPTTQNYTEIALTAGTDNGAQQSFCTVFLDYDFDGDQDFVVANDRFPFPNAFYRNNGDLTFTDISNSIGTNIQIWSMNASCADYNNDGFWDLYHTNVGVSPAVLLEGNSTGFFTDETLISKVTFDRFGWAGNFFDYDNDEDLDLYVVSSYQKPNGFYVNAGNGIYDEPFFLTGGLNGEDTLHGFSSAMADFDNNGLLDIAVNKMTQPFSLYMNYEQPMNNWVKLNLKGVNSNMDAIGAYIESWISGTKRIFEKRISNGYLNQHSNLIHIGIGSNQNIDSLIIRWPFLNSTETIIGPISANQTYTISEGSGIIASIDYGVCAEDIDVHLMPVPSSNYYSSDSLSSNSIIDSSYKVGFYAEFEVLLDDGFYVNQYADFEANIDSCQ